MNWTVLYVEDDPSSRKVMRVLLTHMGVPNIVLFEDSQDFMARVENLNPQPDVIFLDIHVLPYSGFEMLHMLRVQPQYQNTPIIALTASVMNEEVQKLRTAGFSGCLAKPIDIDQFPDNLQRIMDGEQLWRITH